MWSLSVHGHIHPRSNSDLVLSSIGNHAKEGAELKLIKRGDLSLDYQQWSFATPVFSKCTHTTFAAQQAHKDSLVFEKVGSSCSIAESSSERYERVTKKTIVRRWGVFPEGGFFIRCTHGSKNLALTVERDESTSQYRIVIRSLNFKAYKWQLWTYSNGHLINEQTGLALDAQASEDIAIEGEQSQVYLKEKASNEGQFWDLGVNGEIHLRSNERLTIGVASSGDASVEGAQVGISKIRIVRTNVDGKQVSALKSEEWLRWSFSKPVFGKRTVAAAAEGESSLEIEKCEEQTVAVKEQDEVVNDEEEEEEEEEEEQEEAEAALKEAADDSDFEIQTPIQTPSSSTNTSAAAAGVAIVTAGAVVAVAAGTTANVVTSSPTTEEKSTIATVTAVETSAKTDIVATVETPAKVESSKEPTSPVLKKSDSARSQKLTRKDSFQLEENYIPTGFEKIVRYKSHHGGYPSGYFFIKSSLHGYVLDVVGDVKEGSYAVLTRMKSTDFASQMWSFQNGFLVNLKGRVLVLDAANAALVAGERVHLTTRNSKAEGYDDQTWEYSAEGSIHLKSKRSFVLSLKETKRSDKYTQIDVYVQEAKPLVKKQARPEQHWEILVPALIPVSQGESGVKIIESGKIEKVTSSASAIISYRWLKETYCHKVTSQNQWPGTEGWFFIRFGSENHFLAAGDSAQSQVGLYEMSHDLDYRRFLWTYIDGYLINYRYMLRLVLSTSHRWILSNSHSTLNQKFYIHANGSISVRISKIIYYIRFIRTKSGAYTLDVTSDSASKDTQGLELHIPVISDTEYQKKSVLAISSANAWIRKQKSDWSILTSTTVRRGVFPASAWFFVKASYKGADDLVLSVQESSSQLVLKKLDFKSFKNQLWTYNDGLLINYGSKFVIDVQGSVAIKSSIVHAAEAGVSTQKWYLTSEGRIELDSHDFYVLGCDSFKDGAQILLGSSRTSSTVKLIQWKFSTPVFGKRTTTTTTTTNAITDITKEIENGAVIEGAKEVESTNKSQLALTRRTTKHSYVTYRESRLIIRWWRIIFIRRLSTCRTQKEYLEVIEQYRQILYSRFAQYLEVYGSSVSKEERNALEASIEETKSTLETEVFTKTTTYLKTLKSDEEVSSKHLDVSAIVSGCCHSIDEKYETIITKAEKESAITKDTTTTVSTGQQVVKHYESEAEAVDGVLVIVDTIQITIRYWFRTLYGRISDASKNGAKKEEIDVLIKNSQKDLQSQLTKISETTSTTLSGSATLSEEYRKTFENSVTSVIEKSKSEVDNFISNVDVSAVTTVDSWNKLTGAIDNTLSLKFHECKNTVQEVDVVQEIENKKEESVQITEEEVESSKLEIVTTLAESKAYIISWFSNIYKDISWSVESSSSTKEDTLTIVDAAELDIISKIDESVALLSVLSSSLTYLSWTERRRLVTYYISMKTYLLANLKRFRVSIADSDKESILKICQSTFSEEEQTDILKNIDYIVENVSVSTTTTTSTTASGSIVYEDKGSKAVDIIVKDTGSIAVGVISDSEAISQVGAITKESSSISSGVIHGETETSSKIDVITGGSESVTVGVISGKIIDDKESSSIEADVNKSTSTAIDVIETETSSSTVTKDTEVNTAISGEKTETSALDKVTNENKSTITTGVASGIVVGVAAGIVAEVISHEKESSSKVDIRSSESESVTIGVIEDTKTTNEDNSSAPVAIIVDGASTETCTTTVGIVAGEKDTTTTTEVTETESSVIDVVEGEKETCTKTEGSAVGIVVAGGSASKVDVTTEESGSVTIVAGEKDTTTTTTTEVTETESSVIDVVAGEKETITKTEGSAVGIVVAGGSASKVDVTTEESGSVTIVAGEKDTTTTTEVTETESSVIDVVEGEKETITKTEGSAVGIVVAGGSASKDECATIVVSDSASEKIAVVTKDSDDKTSGCITIVSKNSEIETAVKETESLVVGDVVKGHGSVSKTTVAGSVVAGVVAGVIAGSVSGSVVVDEKKSSTASDKIVTAEGSKVDTHVNEGQRSVSVVGTDAVAVGGEVKGDVVGEIDVGVIAVEQGKKTSGVNTVYVSKDSHLYATEVCANYEKVTDSVYGWFARFVEKITSMLEVGECAEDVEAVIVQEKAKLQLNRCFFQL
ncbi:hypothetical protein G6F42_011339 [Rhizopus arrhizus]|nr:hypothetical protein G6F42_011339 [Rhizopus arrhizus]